MARSNFFKVWASHPAAWGWVISEKTLRELREKGALKPGDTVRPVKRKPNRGPAPKK